jgi:DNA-binding SARP family transcriptional activator/tetratricopeptide (TPR) repeat protein
MAAQFRLLGDIGVYQDEAPVEIGPARQQCVLVGLLVEPNRCVPVDQLVDRVWGDNDLPHSPRNAVQTYISLLRRALPGEVRIAWKPAGYVAHVAEQAIDLHRFRRLVKQAADAPDDRAAVLLEDALELWRGEAFGSLDTPWLAMVRARLDKERRAARLDYADIQLRRGEHARLLTYLSDWVDAYPLDERLAGQYMLALHRSGRTGDALRAYHGLRERLISELGTDPGPAVRQLHQQILATDPALAPPLIAPPLIAAVPSHPVPRQLPGAPWTFAGRSDELNRLGSVIDGCAAAGTMPIAVVCGPGGIGKSWLALRWAHLNQERFPDGQLYANLRGFDPSGPPTPPGTVLHGFLVALGVSPNAVPVDVDARAAMFRSIAAAKRVLIMLDNARDADQVVPLLPGSGSCAVLVTSRNQSIDLVSAHGAAQLSLAELSDADAHELLTKRIGFDRVRAERQAVTEIMRYCAGLPLALGIAAARATTQADLPLAALAAELRDARLDVLDGDGFTVGVRDVLACSVRALPPDAADLFGLLGLAPGPDIGLPAVARLAGLPPGAARVVLRELRTWHLVVEHRPARFRMHDLVRRYAVDHAHPERAGALRRLIDYYLHTASHAERLLDPYRMPPDADRCGDVCVAEPLADQAAALAWLDAEQSCLIAAQRLASSHGWHDLVWRLGCGLTTFLRRKGCGQDLHAVWAAGLAAAQIVDDPRATALAHRELGSACAHTMRYRDAVHHLEHAVRLARHTDDVLGEAHAHRGLAWTWDAQDDHQRALTHAALARKLFHSAGSPVWEAVSLNLMGWSHARRSELAEARACCDQALTLHAHHRDLEGQAITLDSLGYIAQQSGEHDRALHYAGRAVVLFTELAHSSYAAHSHDLVARSHAALGDHDQAASHWRTALSLYAAQHRTAECEQIRHRLNALA